MLTLKKGGHCAVEVQVNEWLLPGQGRICVAFQLGPKGCLSCKHRGLEGNGTPGRRSSQGQDRSRTQGDAFVSVFVGTQNLFRGLGKVGWAAGSLQQAWEFGLQPATLENPSQGQCVHPFNTSRIDVTSCVVCSGHKWRNERFPGMCAR